MDDLIKTYDFKVVEAGCAPVSGRYGLQVNIPNDISPVFPYLNALLNETKYDHKNGILIWREGEQAFALRPHEIQVVQAEGLTDTEYSRKLAVDIVERINTVWRQKEQITPCYTGKGRPDVIELYKLLPRTNCKQCGYLTCLVFAADLREGKTKLECCLPLAEPEYADNKRKLAGLLQSEDYPPASSGQGN